MQPLSPQGPDHSKYLSRDTIAALATATGGAVAILRISGPAAARALESVTAFRWDELEAGRMAHTKICSADGTVIDDALIVRFAAPQSFTGEDVLEIQHHGNPLIAERLFSEFRPLGIRQALPGEFSFRAVRNGKMSLSQAEAVADLIAAGNEQAMGLALEKLSGAQAEQLVRTAEALRQLVANAEAGIDFSDQEIEELSLKRLVAGLKSPLHDLEDLAASFQRGRPLQEGIRTSLLGLPNAGKSSFFNRLLGEDRSIVSSIAGTTRDVIREQLNLKADGMSLSFRLEDTAGLRTSGDETEQQGVARTLKSAREAELILFFLDPTGDSGETAAPLRDIRLDHVLGVLTKCDLASAQQINKARQWGEKFFSSVQWIETSAKTGHGVHAVAEAMVKMASRWVARQPREILLTRHEQWTSVCEACEHLRRAQDALGLDLFASDLRQALHALSGLIGETAPDDILGRIFSRFCIGK